MGILLIVVGGIWALLGLGNLVSIFRNIDPTSGLATFGVLLNVVLFVIPGLALAGIGAILRRRSERRGM